MYKLLLCWRYLRTRYLAFVCIVSVMLGVATLIVVNAVMSGFSTKLKDRLHGLLSDVMIESRSYNGFPVATSEILQRIRQSPAQANIEAMSPTIEVFALLSYRLAGGEAMTHVVKLIGVDASSRSAVGGFSEFLQDPQRRLQPSFALSEQAKTRFALRHPQTLQPMPQPLVGPTEPLNPNEPPPPDPPPSTLTKIEPKGFIIGYAIATRRMKGITSNSPHKDITLLHIGDDLSLTTFDASTQRAIALQGVVVDYFKSDMNEYDSNYVYVPLDYLQKMMAWDNRVTSIQIKLKDYSKARETVEELRRLFPEQWFAVHTWEDKQGPLLSAIAVERGILNVLLFLIVGVAGFSILAIFSMIVTEKTRDIGILKSLGASHRGVMSIFLAYGLLLGVVGAGLGTLLGLEITWHINEIEHALAKLTGQEIFPRDVYYFDAIPTNITLENVILVNCGAIAIAVLFSVLPALKAALLHPVRALRYE